MADETTLPELSSENVEDPVADLLSGSEHNDSEDSEDSNEDRDESTNDDVNEDEEDEKDEPTDQSEESDTSEGGEETWAEALGVLEEDIELDGNGSFKSVNVKVDGESSSIGLKDLIAGYQTNKHNTHKSQKLAEDRKGFDQQLRVTTKQYTQKLDEVSKLAEYMHNNLLDEFNQIDWNRLRAEDPAEYAAAQQDFSSRQVEIQKVYQAISTDRTAEETTSASRQKVDREDYLKSEYAKIVSNNPSWDTPEKVKAGVEEIGSFVMSEYGLSSEAFYSIGDSRYFEIAKDAMAFRKGSKVAKKKVSSKLPKYQKSKAGKTRKKVSKLDKLTKAIDNTSGNHKRELQDTAIAELLLGG